MYWYGQGALMTGVWVLAHECGHESFSESDFVNNTVGTCSLTDNYICALATHSLPLILTYFYLEVQYVILYYWYLITHGESLIVVITGTPAHVLMMKYLLLQPELIGIMKCYARHH